MKNGDRVEVWPHGKDKRKVAGTILIISENQRAIAVAFDDTLPKTLFGGDRMIIHQEEGIILMARREELNGKPWGPWIELAGGGHFEIELQV